MIQVTKTFLPSIDRYKEILNHAWAKEWLTNRGSLVLELEKKLMDYLGVDHIIATNNGTVPLQIALKLLVGEGEVITTPFSYVATTAAIIWEKCEPIFVDIDPAHWTIDETKIEAAITERTSAILATHVFGNPCAVDQIETIALRNNLRVIYDAAHAFGVTYKGESIFNFGDVSTCSFHATKLFHTGEGGAMFAKDENLQHRLYYSHNFGHNGQEDFWGLGVNAKMSELQAAMGLAVLEQMNYILTERIRAVDFYNSRLPKQLQKILIREQTSWNYSYYPVVFETEEQLLYVKEQLNRRSIFPRRYFYPSLNRINYVSGPGMPISESISSRILCLPLYAGMPEELLQKISDEILKLY